MRFFPGLHQPSDAKHFDCAFISINRMRRRKTMSVKDWILDCAGFTQISTHGRYLMTSREHAAEIFRCSAFGNLLAAVAPDWMCEDFILAKTGLSVAEHQKLTIEGYDALCSEPDVISSGVYIMPVLQGYKPEEYVEHLRAYGDRLAFGAWVGVGSVCKRNGDPRAIEDVLLAIHRERPDLRLHGFGLKTTALSSGLVQSLLHTADSMAWSFSARKQGRNANDWREAKRWADRIATMTVQLPLFIRRVFGLEAVPC